MASSVDICNLALAHLGDSATVSSISPPEGSMQAEHCARFYPLARDSLLEMHAWNFATYRATLAEVAGAAPDTWAYAYALPNNCLRVLGVYPDGAADDANTEQFVVESSGTQPLILTNTPIAKARFVSRVTDSASYSPLFVNALSYLLASYLAGPVIKGETGMQVSQGMFKWFTAEFAKATAADSNGRKYQPEHNPSWISNR